MARARSLSEFQKAFSDEASCVAFLFKRRWPDGFICPGCARQLEDQLGVTYKTAWLLTQKLRRSMVDPDREPLERVVEVDQAEIPFREGDAFFEPGNAGKILVIGAVEVIDRGVNQARPRRKHAKYLDTRSGRIRLAMIANNSAKSIEAFVKANVKRGTTLITDGHASYPGLTGYRHDPRIVGKMAGHIVLPWIHRAFSLMKRWSLGTYHGLRRKHVDTYLNEFVFRYNRRFHRHVSFEALLGLAAHYEPASYWDIVKRDNPRKRAKTLILLGNRGDRHHLAVITLASEPSEKGAFQELGVETIRFGTPVLARDSHARGMDHMRLDALRPEPTRKPEPVATSLVGNNDTRDRVPRPYRLAAPALEQRQQGVLVGLQLLQRLALDARHETCNEPARANPVIPRTGLVLTDPDRRTEASHGLKRRFREWFSSF